jgi:hypothetical protein
MDSTICTIVENIDGTERKTGEKTHKKNLEKLTGQYQWHILKKDL